MRQFGALYLIAATRAIGGVLFCNKANMRKTLRNLLLNTPIGNWHVNRKIRIDARRVALTWTVADERMGSMYRKFLRAGDLCFDIGANVGNRVKIFRHIGARVIAVEPQAQCIAELRRWYGADQNVVVVEKALGEKLGDAELFRSNFHMISSLSSDWITATRASGRFRNHIWSRGIRVPVTTMDVLIAKFGMPKFVKIDVEGFELQVINGLSQPIPALSLEFTPEIGAQTIKCIRRLNALGRPEFNFSFGESMKFEYSNWINSIAMERFLNNLDASPEVWGDVYARFSTMQSMSVV